MPSVLDSREKLDNCQDSSYGITPRAIANARKLDSRHYNN